MTPSPTAQSLTRREADRRARNDCQRAARQMRLDAQAWLAMSVNLTADPNVYGTRARDYLAGQQARLELVAGWCSAEADRMEAYQAEYDEILGVE